MTTSSTSPSPAAPVPRPGWVAQLAGLGLVALAGVVSGLVGAYSYYDELLNPFAHTFGIWVLLTVAVSARQPVRRAVLGSITALLAAVVAFSVGLQVRYGIRYPGAPYSINLSVVGLWCVLAVVAGAALGLAFSRIGRPGWSGAGAAAAAIGLLLAAAVHRSANYPEQAPILLVCTVLAISVVLVLAGTTGRQAFRTALLTAPFAVLGYAVVSTPDLLEQLIFIGYSPGRGLDCMIMC